MSFGTVRMIYGPEDEEQDASTYHLDETISPQQASPQQISWSAPLARFHSLGGGDFGNVSTPMVPTQSEKELQSFLSHPSEFIKTLHDSPWVPSGNHSHIGFTGPTSNPSNVFAPPALPRQGSRALSLHSAPTYPYNAPPSSASHHSFADTYLGAALGAQTSGSPHLASHSSHTSTSIHEVPRVHNASHRRQSTASAAGPWPQRCTVRNCTKLLKNASDQRKHKQQHEKPFKCCIVTCKRHKLGFGTPNDQDRHHKSVHGLQAMIGNTDGYICGACNPPSKKWWPRKDNFIAHIKRRHPQLDEKDLLESSKRSEKPASARSDSGRDSPSHVDAYEIEQGDGFGELPDLEPSTSQPFPSRDLASPFSMDLMNSPDELAGIGQGTFDLVDTGNRNSNVGSNDFRGHGSFLMPPVANHLGSYTAELSRSMSVDESVHMQDAFADDNGTGMSWSNADHQQGDEQDYEDHTHSHQGFGLKAPSTAESTLSFTENTRTCDFCGKETRRECDLRKHLKRHTRPYGCTFPNCGRRFGSRNDWKRHEISQHSLREMWRCEFPSLVFGNGKCGWLEEKSETAFAHHLTHEHHIPLDDPTNPAADRNVQSMHLGREGYERFWCGFCQSLVPQPPAHTHQNLCAWDYRLQHIGDHFDKDLSDIDDWICVKMNKPFRLLPQPLSHSRRGDKGKSHMTTTVGKVEEEGSDLGDDGIPDPTYIPGFRGFEQQKKESDDEECGFGEMWGR